MYSKPYEIGNLIIKNRFVRSATFEKRAAEDGSVGNALIQFYKELAEGGVGLIITGFLYVQPNGQSVINQMSIDRDDLIPGLKNLTDTIHKNGDGCKVVAQIVHCGRQTYFVDSTVDPSGIPDPMTGNKPRAMTVEEIEEVIENFALAAKRCKEAGFDGVQLHGAHGYLLSEFLSPHTNRRNDEYGGNTENRIKIIEKIYNRSVELIGKDFPMLIKMNGADFLEGGIDLNESKKIAERFSKMGIAAIEISSCMYEVTLLSKEELGWAPAMTPEARININSKEKEAYHLPYAKEIKKLIDVPLILVGGLRSIDVIEQILEDGNADFIALSRPLIREPDLPNKWLKGIGEQTCECISCNGCVGSMFTGAVRCTQLEKK